MGDFIQNNWMQITVIYLALVKLLTAIRDAIDKTPATDDNLFERIVTIAKKSGEYLLLGKRS